MALARANQALTEIQAYCQDKFHLYRNGLPGAGDTLGTILVGVRNGDPAAVARWARITARFATIPRPGNFRFILWHRARLRAMATARRTPFRGRELPPIPRPDENIQEAIGGQLNNFRDLLRSSFRYVKCVGWGRDGVLTLWRYQPSRGQEFRVVMKQSAYGARQRGRQRARPVLSTGMIMRERDIMTVSPNCSQNSPVSSHLDILTNACLSDAVSSPPHCTTVLYGRSSGWRSRDSW